MTPSTNWKEQIQIGEAEKLEKLAEQLRAIQRKNAKPKAVRALHTKSNINVAAELRIHDNLPEHARVGIFAAPQTYQAYVRYSNGGNKVQHDARGDVRGVAFKVLGVPGAKLIPGLEGATTQDFLLIQTSFVPFKNPFEFVGLVEAANNPAKLPGFLWRTGLGRALKLGKTVTEGMSRKVYSLAASQYWSALPVQWGQYAARYTLKPTAPATENVDRKDSEYLRNELAARLAQGPVSYEFQAQFFVDEATTPIEDPTIDWSSPYTTLATLTIHKHDVNAAEALELSKKMEEMSFDPWHAPKEFKPLGQMMRARSHAYKLSTIERNASPEL
jgi:catalase